MPVVSVHAIVLQELVEKEGLVDGALVLRLTVHDVQQVWVVEVGVDGLLGELLAAGVEEGDHAGVLEVFEVVHHGGVRCRCPC